MVSGLKLPPPPALGERAINYASYPSLTYEVLMGGVVV